MLFHGIFISAQQLIAIQGVFWPTLFFYYYYCGFLHPVIFKMMQTTSKYIDV